MARDTLVRPSWLWVPEHDSTDGPEAADLAATVGWDLDGEQRLTLDAMLARRGDRWAAFAAAAIEPRQNGKTHGAEAACLHDLFMRGVGRVVWTAHRYKTTADSFSNLAAVCENYDHLRRRVYRIQLAAGEQSIQLLPRHTGPRVDFLARSSGGGRGLDGEVVVLDEALFVAPMMMGALLPLLSAKADPQVRYLSSAGVATSDVLRSIRDRGRAGGDPSLMYIEWGDPDPRGCADKDCDHRLTAAGCALDDRDRWRANNPAMGRRISEDYVAAERRELPPEEFARERLGWWDDPVIVQEGIGEQTWAALFDPAAAPRDPVWFGLDVAPNHAAASIVAAGGGAIELVDRRPGSNWLVARCVELLGHAPAGFAYDPSGPVGVLAGELEAAGVHLTAVEGQESVRACGSFTRAILERSFRHRGEPEFASAVAGARRRPVGDGHKWSRKDSTVDISPLVAATVALWAHSEHEFTATPGVFVI